MDGLPVQPLAAAVAAVPLVQRQQSIESAREAATARARRRVSSAADGQPRREVESPEAVNEVGDREARGGATPRHRRPSVDATRVARDGEAGPRVDRLA